MRLPLAAKTLVRQVREAKPKAVIEPYGDPDGLGVRRTVRFSKSAGKWLQPLLEEINDPRIASVSMTEADYLHVTFVAGIEADDRSEFPLADAETVTKG